MPTTGFGGLRGVRGTPEGMRFVPLSAAVPAAPSATTHRPALGRGTAPPPPQQRLPDTPEKAKPSCWCGFVIADQIVEQHSLSLGDGSFLPCSRGEALGISPWLGEGWGGCGSTPGPRPCVGLGAESEAGAATHSLGINSIPWRGCGLFPVTRSPAACPWSSCFLGAGGDGVCVTSEG